MHLGCTLLEIVLSCNSREKSCSRFADFRGWLQPPRIKGSRSHVQVLKRSAFINLWFLTLQSWRPSKEVPKPRPGKVLKKCFGKCRSETGCFGKCQKKCSGSRLLYYLYIGAEPGALFSVPSSAPRFGPALSEVFFDTFPTRGFGTSLDGRQDCNSNLHSENIACAKKGNYFQRDCAKLSQSIA